MDDPRQNQNSIESQTFVLRPSHHISLDQFNRPTIMDDHQRQNQNSTESQTFKLPLRISQHISLDKFNQQTTTVNDDEPQNPNATGSQKGDDDDSRKPPADWVYRDGWITVSYPFLRSLLHLHKHSLEKRQIKRWDYLVDAEWAYTKIWNKRALLYNERMDLKLYKKAMLVKQRDAMKNKIHEKPEMLERLKDSVNAQKRTDRQIQDVNKRIRQAEKAVHQSAVELSYMTKCFIERDLPILADMTDELIKEQAKQGRWDHKALMIRTEMTILMRNHKWQTKVASWSTAASN